jgi:hypothetical protein
MSTPQQQEQQKKMIAYAVFGALIVGLGIYEYETNFADNSPPPQTATVQPRVDPALANKPVVTTRSQSAAPNSGTGVAAGVAATRMASTSSSLDPTLDERAMLRTENLVYSGNGRNMFRSRLCRRTYQVQGQLRLGLYFHRLRRRLVRQRARRSA